MDRADADDHAERVSGGPLRCAPHEVLVCGLAARYRPRATRRWLLPVLAGGVRALPPGIRRLPRCPQSFLAGFCRAWTAWARRVPHAHWRCLVPSLSAGAIRPTRPEAPMDR